MTGHDRGNWGARHRMLEGMCNVLEAGMYDVGGRCFGHMDLGWEPGHSVTNSNHARVPDPNAVTAVGIKCRPNIPSIQCMRGPGCAVLWFVVDKDTAARRGQWPPIEIKETIDMRPRG